MWIQHAHNLTELKAGNAYGFYKIGIIAHNDCRLITSQMSIMNYMRRDIDIRAFFFSFCNQY